MFENLEKHPCPKNRVILSSRTDHLIPPGPKTASVLPSKINPGKRTKLDRHPVFIVPPLLLLKADTRDWFWSRVGKRVLISTCQDDLFVLIYISGSLTWNHAGSLSLCRLVKLINEKKVSSRRKSWDFDLHDRLPVPLFVPLFNPIVRKSQFSSWVYFDIPRKQELITLKPLRPPEFSARTEPSLVQVPRGVSVL